MCVCACVCGCGCVRVITDIKMVSYELMQLHRLSPACVAENKAVQQQASFTENRNCTSTLCCLCMCFSSVNPARVSI